MRPTIPGGFPALICCSLPALTALLASPPARAGEDLRARVQPIGSLPRPGGPLPLLVTLERSAPGVLNGRLELEVPPPVKLVLRTPELSLGPGVQKIQVNLPPWSWSLQAGELYIHARFLGEEETVDLGEEILFPSIPFERVFKILAVSEGLPGPRDSAILEALRLEAYYRKEGGAPCPIATSLATLEAAAVPARPLELCAYDVVYLAGQSFDLLSAAQLDAIRRWVQAGGSVCLQLRSAPPAAQRRFLRELTSESFAAGLLRDLSGEAGQETAPRRHRRFRSGLGRVLALAAGVPHRGDVSYNGWLDSVGFLWKVRRHLRRDLETRGSWTASRVQFGDWSFGESTPRPGPCPAPASARRVITEELLPYDIAVLPTGLIVVLLVVFVLAIGPLEYGVLGYFARRKLTWYVFPLTCTVFAVLTMFASELFLSAGQELRSLLIVDLGAEGRVLRWNRLDLHYHQGEETLVEDASGRLTSVCDETGAPGLLAQPSSADLSFEGRIPGSYRLRHHVRKWSPRLLRSLSLERPELGIPDSQLNWDSLRGRLFDETRSYVAPLPLRSALFGPDDRSAFHLYSGSRDLCPKHDGTESSSDVLDALVHGDRGPLATLAQLSPTAGPSIQDLPVLDPGDPDQVLVVVVREQGPRTLVLRRLFYREELRNER